MLDQFQLIHIAVGIIAVWSLNYFYLRGKNEEIKRLRREVFFVKECANAALKEIDSLSFQLNETKEKIKILSKSNVETFKLFAQINFELNETKEKFRKLNEAHRKMKYRYEDYRKGSKATIKELNCYIVVLEEIIENERKN